VGLATLAEALSDASPLAQLHLERCGIFICAYYIYIYIYIYINIHTYIYIYTYNISPIQAIGVVGLASLAEALPDSSPLAHLDLERCGIHIYIYIYVCVYIYMYVCIYIYISD